MERPTPAQIRRIIDQAQCERSRVLGDMLARGAQAIGRIAVAVFRTASEAAAMRNARTPQHLRLKLRQHESAAH